MTRLVLPLCLPRRATLASLLVMVTAGCPAPYVEQPTQVRFENDTGDFWAQAFPSDLRTEEDGTLNIDRWPGEWDNDLLTLWLRAANRRLTDGWGLSSGVFFPLTGPIDGSSLPVDERAAMDPNASAFIVDIDPDSPEYGRRFPLRARVLDEVDLYTPEHLLALLPPFGFTRRPSTLYAAVLTDSILDGEGTPLGRSETFHNAFADAAANEPEGDAAKNLAPLRRFYDEQRLDADRVVGASVFHTFDPNRDLLSLASFYDELDAPQLSEPWVVAEEYASYQVLTARYEVPQYQTGRRPYDDLGEGLIIWGDDGKPVIQEWQGVRLALTIPKVSMPAAGFPLTLYMHGSGGEYYQAINRSPKAETDTHNDDPAGEAGLGPAEWLARRGVATLAFDYPLHGDRSSPSDTTGLKLYNIIGNPDATVDNFNVAAAETTYLTRLVNEMMVDAGLATSLAVTAAPGDTIMFDPERLTAMGQSMGTTLGVATATIDPRIKGYVFSGAGGILIEIAVTATEPFPFRGLVEEFLEMGGERGSLHVDHPILHALQHMWDYVDPVVKGRHVTAEPHPGQTGRDVLMTAGIIDGYFHPRAQKAIAVGLQASLVGDEVEPVLPDGLRLSGLETLEYPLQGNLRGNTIGVVQHAAPFDLGHYVVFNQDGPRHQYTCFITSVGRGAQISEPGALDDACPQ